MHARLVEAGQALAEADMPTFLLTLRNEDGTLIGGCKGEIAFRSAHVSELWVDAAQRGRGIGQRLLNAAEAHARARSCTRIHIETRNPAARRLYEKAGYRVFGTLADYADGADYWYLEKPLPPVGLRTDRPR
ncbi:hypothetical protein ATO11_06745 [Pseudaestuariivita atlantica]|uniref:N-acetyltransferase domain-containing protein n=1 Tax=Pseudaestuariivita atlantica TaxID=1317121 RepID=A0A0L1JRN9_9RHOB|nr:hypothetical protein ATO11_06745 [Pseudaestuariivita atlantica]